MIAVMCASLDTALQDPAAKLASVKAAQKFFSEDKDRSFEAKVCVTVLAGIDPLRSHASHCR